MNIRNNNDLRIAYESLNMYKRFRPEATTEQGKQHADKRIMELKHDIRKYHNKEADRRIFRADYDGWVELIEAPEWVETEEDAELWFENEEYMHPIYREYDCTGCLFTAWYHLFKRRGHWMAYHRIAMDV